jgi:5'-3' exonuclease
MPFEAKWQLVFLERMSIVDCIYTPDGDAIVLGAKMLITRSIDIDFKNKNC